MSLDTYAWIPSIQRVKEFLEIESTKDDSILERITNAATVVMERKLARRIISREHTVVFDGNGRTQLLLPHWPVTAIDSVYLNRFGTEDGVAHESDYYEYNADDDEEGILFLLSGYLFPHGHRNVKVVWTAGYTTTTIPADLVELLLEYVAHLWKKKDSLGEERLTQSMEGVTVTFARDFWTAERKSILAKYRSW